MKLRAVLAVVAPLALVACSRPGGSAAPGPSTASKPATGTGVVAEVNGGPIQASELEQRVGSRLTRLKQEEYEIRRQVLDEMIGERLVAAQAEKSGQSAEALLQREVDAKVKLPSETEIRGIYEQNKFRFGVRAA